MTIKAARNLYAGVNPHLNSFLQTPGTAQKVSLWEGFHAAHIGYLADRLNQTLPPGYFALQEQSLQLWVADWQTGFSAEQRRKPDVGIYSAGAKPVAQPGMAASPTLVLDLMDTLDEDEQYFNSIVIREQDSGDLVTRIELLSPANKPGYSAFFAYRQKRLENLHSGLPLVEIDYLHEIPSVIDNLPRYPHEANAFAYNIYVSDPRPSMAAGSFRAYSSAVGSSLPTVSIPLIGAATVALELDGVYQETFNSGRWGTRPYLDYSVQPARFETYSPADQARILQRMAAIAAAVAHGDDLEAWQGD
jgi:hypothetical protein